MTSTPFAARRAAPELETERLRLRQFRESDFPIYEDWCANPDLMRYLGGRTFGKNGPWLHIATMLGHWQLRGYGLWAVEERATGDLVGRIGLFNPEGWPGFEIGWALARPFWGRGYAMEGARASLHHARDVLGRDRVISLIRPANERSIKVARKIGETPAGEVDLRGSKALVYEVLKR